MLGKHWTPTQGAVMGRHSAMTTGGGMVTIYEFIVDVRTAEGETSPAKLDEPRIATNFLAPSIGNLVEFESSRRVRFNKNDPALNANSAKRQRKAAFDQTLDEPAGITHQAGQALEPRIVELHALFQPQDAQPPPTDSILADR